MKRDPIEVLEQFSKDVLATTFQKYFSDKAPGTLNPDEREYLNIMMWVEFNRVLDGAAHKAL